MPRNAQFETQPQKKSRRVFQKRGGRPSGADKALIRQYVEDQPGEIKRDKVVALAHALGRTVKVTKQLIEDARQDFSERIGRYTDIHFEATEGALESGDFKSALVGSQWAMQNIDIEGERVVQPSKVATADMPRIMIGVKIGGVDLDRVQAQDAVIVTNDPTPK